MSGVDGMGVVRDFHINVIDKNHKDIKNIIILFEK